MGHDPDAMNDAQIDALIRGLDPLRELKTDELLTLREQATLQRIMVAPEQRASSPASVPPARRNFPLVLSMAVTAVVAMIAIVLVWPPAAPRAVALTPPPLQLSSSSQPIGEVVSVAHRLLTRSPREPHAERKVSSVGWYLQMDHLTTGDTRSVIAPQVIHLTWEADGSGREVITAGVPYLADGSPPPDPDSAPAEGSQLSETTYPAGGFGSPIDHIPGNTEADVRELLSAYWSPVAADPSASDIITAVSNAFGSWTLTDEQHAHILTMLSTAPGATVAGTAVDRAGRDATVIAPDSTTNPDFRQFLLISNETGRIVGTENVRLTPLGDLLPAGAVTSYTLWETR